MLPFLVLPVDSNILPDSTDVARHVNVALLPWLYGICAYETETYDEPCHDGPWRKRKCARRSDRLGLPGPVMQKISHHGTSEKCGQKRARTSKNRYLWKNLESCRPKSQALDTLSETLPKLRDKFSTGPWAVPDKCLYWYVLKSNLHGLLSLLRNHGQNSHGNNNH